MKLGVYRHFKGNAYQLLGVALHTETGEVLAMYTEYPDKVRLWARPLEMFEGTVEADGITFPRFRYERELVDENPERCS